MSYKIQEVFNRFYSSYTDKYGTNYEHAKVAKAIMSCKTNALGANASICTDCGGIQVYYNSCRNRHCPCCQALVKEKWIDKQKEDVIDAPYFHVVFTVPSELNPLIYSNKKTLYGLLYRASADTLLELGLNPKHLGAKVGFLSILHTWGSSLTFHPHIHSIVLGGGLTKELKFASKKEDFLFPVRVVSRLFRGKFLANLKELYKTKQLEFFGKAKKYEKRNEFEKLLTVLYKKEWIPHIKETFKGAANVIAYLGRYTHNIAISNSRIQKISKEGITFKIKDYKSNQEKSMTLNPIEFIRRFLMHVLPKGFVKIRRYGILSNKSKKISLVICRNILKGIYPKSRLAGLKTVEIIKELFGIDILCCRHCGARNLKPYPYFHKME
ncbi:MAG: IS91 family transposase [candidate division Zixibacteria bacterium]|nr:IS91 family transposase [candidate division Zixibacteria bacterium]